MRLGEIKEYYDCFDNHRFTWRLEKGLPKYINLLSENGRNGFWKVDGYHIELPRMSKDVILSPNFVGNRTGVSQGGSRKSASFGIFSKGIGSEQAKISNYIRCCNKPNHEVWYVQDVLGSQVLEYMRFNFSCGHGIEKYRLLVSDSQQGAVNY